MPESLQRRVVALWSRYSEVLAYLVVGGWNTVFGLGAYSLAYWLWGEHVHYMILSLAVNVLSISNAFLCYKLFVFKTRGHWLAEYLRCYVVYGVGALLNMGLLWLQVTWLELNPVLANIFATVLVVVVSYFGHKFFSFRKGEV